MSFDFSLQYLGKLWQEIDWAEVESSLAEKQAELTRATQRKDWNAIIRIQRSIAENLDFKCLAVRHVAESGAGPGVDGVRWKSDGQKMQAAMSLTNQRYIAQPLKMYCQVDVYTGRERWRGMSTYYDKAMQVLYGYTLLPVTEALAERQSFAFRRGRSTHDCIAFIVDYLSDRNVPEYIVVADVKTFYATIQHDWIMNHVPMQKYVLKQFLKAGYIYDGALFDDVNEGISEGSNIAPYIANFVLDGLQKHIYRGLHDTTTPLNYYNGRLIRFADDMIVTVNTKEEAEKVLVLMTEFLKERGLVLSERKTYVTTAEKGFGFLAHTIIKKGDNVYFYPSEKSVNRFISNIKETIQTNLKSQRNLILLLNKKLDGFGNYHKFSDSEVAFREIDTAVQTALLESAIAKNPTMPKQKVIEKYWFKEPDGRHSYSLPEDRSIKVHSLIDIVRVPHQKVRTDLNPFLDKDEIEERTHEREINNVVGQYRAIWNRQNGHCYYCGRAILVDQARTVVPLDIRRPPSKKNLAYIHKMCEENTFELVKTMEDVTAMRPYDVLAALKLIEGLPEDGQKVKKPITNKWKHYRLKMFFRDATQASITLTFQRFEQINGNPIPNSGLASKEWWMPRRDANKVAEAWLTEGYVLDNLDLVKKKATFKRLNEGYARLQIPDVFLSDKLPNNAIVELENYFAYIKKRYGL